MTKSEADRVSVLQHLGWSCSMIANELQLSVNTVKSFCKRHPVEIEHCKQCGKRLIHIEHKKKKIFCSEQCRRTWWHNHPSEVKRKKIYHHVCNWCGSPFESIKPTSLYCSRKCYAEVRRKENKHE